MKVLALELSSATGSMAWRDGDKTEFSRNWPNDRRNSGAFFANLEAVQKEFGSADRIIVGLGPGSYAGTRIAISTAIGLSLGRDKARPSIEAVGYPSICAIECESDEYCVIGDARRQSFFFARVRQENLADGPDLLKEEELRARIAVEERTVFSVETLPHFEKAVLRQPSADLLARIGADATRRFWPLEPMYLREPHITLPKSR